MKKNQKVIINMEMTINSKNAEVTVSLTAGTLKEKFTIYQTTVNSCSDLMLKMNLYPSNEDKITIIQLDDGRLQREIYNIFNKVKIRHFGFYLLDEKDGKITSNKEVNMKCDIFRRKNASIYTYVEQIRISYHELIGDARKTDDEILSLACAKDSLYCLFIA